MSSRSHSKGAEGAPRRKLPRLCLVLACLALAAGCRMDMQDQPKYIALRESDFFKDGSSARPLIEGTVPRGYLRADTQFYTGKISRTGATGGTTTGGQSTRGTSAGTSAPATGGTTGAGNGSAGADATTFPFPVTEDVVRRGKERYQIFCAVCHGLTGNGDGMIVRRGYRHPPSYHTDALRSAPVGHFFDVMTNGWGSMPDYAEQIPPGDRWAIIAYIRALQLSEQGSQPGTQLATNTQTNQSGGGK